MSSGEVVEQFGPWDYVVLTAMLCVSAGIGVYHAFAGGGQRTAETFLLADRNMNPIPVAVSLVASFISAVTVLGTPAENYIHGIKFWYFSFAYVLAGLAVSRCFIPIFYTHEITSTNEVSVTPQR